MLHVRSPEFNHLFTASSYTLTNIPHFFQPQPLVATVLCVSMSLTLSFSWLFVCVFLGEKKLNVSSGPLPILSCVIWFIAVGLYEFLIYFGY